jgi:hypothetical protein
MTSPCGAEDALGRSHRRPQAPSSHRPSSRPLRLYPGSLAQGSSERPDHRPRVSSREYARGIAQGAPEAVEVLDRWHLLKNLREEALEHVLDRNQKVLSGIALSSSERTYKTTGSPGTSDYTPPPRSPSERARSRTARKRRYARYEKVRKLCTPGA